MLACTAFPPPPPYDLQLRHHQPLFAPPMLSSLLRRVPASLHLVSSPSYSTTLCRRSALMSARFSSSTVGAPARARLRGVVFDMDGTLTIPVIDFPAMYRTILGDDTYAMLRSRDGAVDILHHIETWGEHEQRKAYEIIARFEQDGLDRLQIMPGAEELCQFLDSQRLRRGLITRNVKAAVDLFHQRFGMEFDPALSREFRPYKPHPAPLIHICSTWNISPNEVIMIGDSLKDDVACGKRAGAYTCLLDETGRYDSAESVGNDLTPDFKVSSLVEVHTLLENHFDLSAA